MTGSVKEGDVLVVDINSVSTDVLSNTACLACSYVCMTDLIEKRGLTVVNVTHNNNDRSSFNEVFFAVHFFAEQLFFNGNDNLLGYCRTHFVGNKEGGIVVDILID